MAVRELSVDKIVRRRLVSQLLIGSRAKTPEEVVSRLGGIQAQDYGGGEWSIGIRLPGSTLPDIERAVAERKIVRTWAMRGTLHFVAAADIDWILTLLAPIQIAGNRRRYDELGLDESTLRKTNSILERALSGNKQLTRAELVGIIESRGISCEGQRAPYILQRASVDRLICFGVSRGKQFTFTLFDDWVGRHKTMGRDEALGELALRYFTGHGPATIQDYMWWSGLKAADAKSGLESVGSGVVRAGYDGREYWMTKETRAVKWSASVAHLLPGFDEFLLGYSDKSASLDAVHAGRIQAGGMLRPTIEIKGKIAGTWGKNVTQRQIEVEVEPFTSFTHTEGKAVAQAVTRYKTFLGTVSFPEDVSAGKGRTGK